MVETEGMRRGRVVGRGLGLVADRHPVSSCCSHRVFVEWACCALVPCCHWCHITAGDMAPGFGWVSIGVRSVVSWWSHCLL